MLNNKNNKPNGFTMIELLLTMTIGGILITIALLSMSSRVDDSRLRGAAESFYGGLLHAQNTAVNHGANTYVDVNTGNSWCYALSDASGCDCASQSCTVNNQQHKSIASNYNNVSLSSTNHSGELTFESINGAVSTGISSSPATFTFTANNNKTAQVSLTSQGKVNICSSDLGEYGEC